MGPALNHFPLMVTALMGQRLLFMWPADLGKRETGEVKRKAFILIDLSVCESVSPYKSNQ